MSAIDDLKNPTISLDPADNSNDELLIDNSNGIPSTINSVKLSNLGNKPKSHQIITPKSKELSNTNQSLSTTNRRVININAVAQKDPEDEKAHVSPMDDMVNPDNPNSMISKYVKEKEIEAREWIADKQEEQEILKEEKELDLEEENNSSNEYIAPTSNPRMSRDEDMDLSSLLDDDKNNNREEKETMTENDNIVLKEENITPDIDKDIDKESLVDVDEIDVEEDYSNDEDDEYVVESETSDIEYEESISVPDIDVEEQEDNFVAEIEDDDDVSTTEVGTTDDNEVLKHLQKLATEKLKPVSNKLDISSFTVLKKPATNVNPIFQASSARVVKWVLPAQESIVLMKEFSGAELEKLREYSENTRSVDSLNRKYHMIYDHIVSPKPANFEQWMKSTPYEDINHYTFAIYVACFKGANYLPADCINDKCKETFITDDINIMDMVKFDSTEVKNKFVELYQSEATPAGKGVYCTEIVPITNTIAIAFRQPSLYNIIEVATLDAKSRSTYSHILDYIPYIDTIYAIDAEQHTLTPISYKTFPDNAQRTIRSKIKKFESIFSLMSVDEFGPVKAYIRAIVEKNAGISYVYPAVECPKCHTSTNEQPATAEELVFTRYQLGSLVTTSLN